MENTKKEIEQRIANILRTKLWNIADILRSRVNAEQYKDYALGLIFYKFLSNKFYRTANLELKKVHEEDSSFPSDFKDFSKEHESYNDFKEYLTDTLGYFISKEYLFSSLIELCKHKETVITKLQSALTYIETNVSKETQDDFEGLFDDINLTGSVLGKTDIEKDLIIRDVLLELHEIDIEIQKELQLFTKDDTKEDYENIDLDILGDAYEYMIGEFSINSVKSSGQHYTPQCVSKILAQIVTLNNKNIVTAYDPTCGSGSLLLQIKKICEKSGNENVHLYGQELNKTSFNLARMNMFLHGVSCAKFDIKQGDTLFDPQHTDKFFEAIVANPPFSLKWNPEKEDKEGNNNSVINTYVNLGGIVSQRADFAFVQHMYSRLDSNGTIAVVLPLGVLFRNEEKQVRKFLIEKENAIDTIIALPNNLFFGTGIASCIMVLKKNRTNNDILFINASTEFQQCKKQNTLLDKHIEKIINTYKDRKNIDEYAHLASFEEITKNDFNLTISRYLDSFKEEEEINLDDISKELQCISKEMQEVDAEIAKYCEELGIKGLDL